MNNMPTSLQAQLERTQQRLWIVETIVAVLGGVFGLLASYLLLFISDRVWPTPVWLRFGLTAAGMIGAALGAWWWAARLGRRRDLRTTARLIQKRHPRLGDRLLSIVELSRADQLPPNISRSLVDAAMQQVAAESTAYDFQQAVPTRSLRRWVPAVIVVAGLTLAALVFVPSAGLNAWKRWFRPLAAKERFTFARLQPLGETRIVPNGEPFAVTATLQTESQWRPRTGSARVERQAPLDASLTGDLYSFSVPGQTQPGLLTVAVGDARETLRIEPAFRPNLVALNAEVELPPYLEYPAQFIDARKGAIDLLPGSRVSFTGRIQRTLDEASITVPQTQPLAVDGDTFRSEKLAFETVTKTVEFTWRDNLGLEQSAPFALSIQWREDKAPKAECRELERVTAILADETLHFQVAAEDDFGVKAVGLRWQVIDGATGESATGKSLPGGAYEVAAGRPQDRTLQGETTFSPKVFGLESGRVDLRATAVDYRPGRVPAESVVYTVVILDKTAHAKLVQQAMEKQAQLLQKLATDEIEQAELTRRLREKLAGLDDAKPDGDIQAELDKLTKRLREARRTEQANRETAMQVAENIQELAEEALRNDRIPAPTMQTMAEIQAALRQISQQEMQQAQNSLQNAQQASAASQTGQRSEQMQNAQEMQQTAAEKLRTLAKEIRDEGKKIRAATFANRLREAAKHEKQIRTALGVVLPHTLGATFNQLPQAMQGQLRQLKAKQDETQAQVQLIKDDIGLFLRRLPVSHWQTVHDEMEKLDATGELAKLATMIGSAQVVSSIQQTERWEKQLLAWADKLKQDRDEASDSDQQQDQDSPEEPEQWMLEFMLAVGRTLQQEQDIREQTRALEARRSDLPQYESRAKQLADQQEKMRTEFANLPATVKMPAEAAMKVGIVLGQVNSAMGDAVGILRKPDTGPDAIAAETVVIELLGTLLDAAGNRQQMSAAGQQKAAQMQQMLQRMRGKSAGMGRPGGLTTQASPEDTGSGEGTAAAQRRVEQAAGLNTESLPVEYREALEGYFNRVENN